MRSYSARHVFAQSLLDLLAAATAFVDRVVESEEEIRCHELTRAAAIVLGLPPACVQDGYYGFADHSWLWVPSPPKQPVTKRLGWPHALDVYCVGRLPQVQLVACDNPGLPHVGWSYRPDSPRTDVDQRVVDRLVREASRPRRGADLRVTK